MEIYVREEIEKILEKYGDTIYRMAFVQTKSRDASDDIYQEVCLKLLREKKRFETEEYLKAWLLRVTINCCKDYWKSAWYRKIVCNMETDTEEQATNDEQEVGFVTKCVWELPEKYRMLIHLYYYEEYSQKEIAQMLKLNENTVASRLSRGRNKLKRIMESRREKQYGF